MPSCSVHAIQTVSQPESMEVAFDLPFTEYRLQSKILLSGIGADEMCGGYMRYQTAFDRGNIEESWREMMMDWNRLWFRNLVVFEELS